MSNLITPKGGWTGKEIPKDDPYSEGTAKPETNAGMFCPECRAEYRAGFTTCSDCHVPLVSQEALDKRLNLSEPKQPAAPAVKCVQHPEIDAVARCRACSARMCGTCDFEVSAGLHFCPKCIETADDQDISPRRKKFARGSLGAAIYCTLVGLFTFSGALYEAMGGPGNEQALGLFVMYGLYVPSVIGTALGLCAYERRLKNTTLIWTALIWSGAVTVIFLLLEVAGRFMEPT